MDGAYDFTLPWEQDDASRAPSILTAVQEQLGLKLEFRQASVGMLVVERAERTPTEN
jgi:uncharacterized protein (TIGR03435 family)